MNIRRPHLDAADGMMLAVVGTWAVNNIFMKYAVRELPPFPFVAARSTIVLALVWGWVAWRRTPARIALSDAPWFILAGITGFGVFNALYMIGLERTSAFSAALLLSISPIFTLVFARLLGLERPSSGQWLAVLIAAGGVALFIGDKLWTEGFGVGALGDLFGLASAILFAVYSLVARPLTQRYGAVPTTAWAVLFGLVAFAPWGVPASLRQPWTDLTWAAWGSLFFAGAVGMLVGYSLWGAAVARVGIARTAPYLFLTPVATGLISAVVFGEVFGPLKLLGAAMVLAGTALVRALDPGVAKPRQDRVAEGTMPGETLSRMEAATADSRPGD